MGKTVRLTAEDNLDGGLTLPTRLDIYLAGTTEMSRSQAVKLIDAGLILWNGKTAGKKQQVQSGDIVEMTLPNPVPSGAIPQNIPLDIVYEDNDLLVINKPSGMVVHPAPGNEDGTLVNGLLYHCKDSLSGIGGVIRPGIVHRIDKDTSGLLVVAKNDEAHVGLSSQLKGHHIDRIYYAIVLGHPKEDRGTVDKPIGRHPVQRQKMAVIADPTLNSRPAVTHYRVERTLGSCSLVRCQLETGRTHQIRVHMASLGHPILGDPLYGGDRTPFQAHHPQLFCGQCLHAGELSFVHPMTGEKMCFTAPIPENMQKIMDLLELQNVK